MAIDHAVIGVEQHGGAALGDVVVTGHVGAPVAEHFIHVAQTLGGELKRSLEPGTTGLAEQSPPEARQRKGFNPLFVVEDLGRRAISGVTAQHLAQGARRTHAGAHQQKTRPGPTGELEAGLQPQGLMQLG